MKIKSTFVIISLVFLILSSLNILTSIPLERGDNYYNILGARGILDHNLKPIGDFDIFQHGSDVTLNHPPLNSYFYALILYIFKTPLALSFISILFILASGIVSLGIAKIVYKKISDQTLAILYSLILLCPLIVQGSYLIDFDVILCFVILIFVYFYLKNPEKIIINSIFFMLIWMTKIQGVPIIILSLFLYLVLTGKKKNDYLNVTYIILIGSGLFFLLIFIYSFIFGTSFSRIFVHSSIIDILKKQISNPAKTFLTSFWEVKQIVIWLIPSTILLYILSIFEYFKSNWKKYDKFMLLILISLVTFLELIPIGTYGWNFPKYYLEIVPFLFLIMIPLIEKIKFDKNDLKKIIVLAAVVTVYFLIIPDPYIPEVSEAFTDKNYLELGTKVMLNFDFFIIPIIVTFFLYWNSLNKKKIYKILLISSLILFVSINIMQVTKPYSTNNMYGDSISDLKKTLDYLKVNTNSGDKALLFDHVGYYFGNSDNSNWYNSMLCYNSEACMTNMTNNPQVKFMQFYPKDLERIDGRLKSIIGDDFSFDVKFGDYLIYKRIVP